MALTPAQLTLILMGGGISGVEAHNKQVSIGQLK